MMRLSDARAILQQHGLTLRKQDGEYRVAFGLLALRARGIPNAEDSAYYTNDLADAVETGKDMVQHG